MTKEMIIGIVNRFTDEVWNKGNMNYLKEVVTPDFKYHDPVAAPEDVGLQGYHQFISDIRSRNSEIEYSILDMVAEDNAVAVHYSFKGIHRNGKLVEHEGAVFYFFRNNKIARILDIWDALTAFKQIGRIQ